MPQMKAIHAHITGRVQGVSFRAWTRIEAQIRDLTGWVRNETDGSVTALIAGRASAVDEMKAALHKGPPAAVVNSVEFSEAEMPEGGGFDILR